MGTLVLCCSRPLMNFILGFFDFLHGFGVTNLGGAGIFFFLMGFCKATPSQRVQKDLFPSAKPRKGQDVIPPMVA